MADNEKKAEGKKPEKAAKPAPAETTAKAEKPAADKAAAEKRAKAAAAEDKAAKAPRPDKGGQPGKDAQPEQGGQPEKGAKGAGKGEKGGPSPAKGDKGAAAAKGDKDAAAAKGGKGAAAAKGGKGAPATEEPAKPARLKVHYDQVIKAKLIEAFGYKNVMQTPRLEKVVINMGVGEGVNDRKKVEQAAADLALIAGQRAVITLARKSIATFKVREGQPIGCKVTLRKARMYEFVDRLVNVALPRVRDFRGLSPKSFDGRGNYTLGVKEHIVFPEIDYDKAADVWGMDITICTTARTDAEGRALLAAFNFPFRQ